MPEQAINSNDQLSINNAQRPWLLRKRTAMRQLLPASLSQCRASQTAPNPISPGRQTASYCIKAAPWPHQAGCQTRIHLERRPADPDTQRCLSAMIETQLNRIETSNDQILVDQARQQPAHSISVRHARQGCARPGQRGGCSFLCAGQPRRSPAPLASPR